MAFLAALGFLSVSASLGAQSQADERPQRRNRENRQRDATASQAQAALARIARAQAQTQAAENDFVGLWEGADSKGDIYTLKFINGAEFESYVEQRGMCVPIVKGTYAASGARVDLQVSGQVDTNTMKWAAADRVFPTMTGRISGDALNVLALTEADLKKAPAGKNPFAGIWEGKDSSGNIFTFKFGDSEWEASAEAKGVVVPLYKGTYTFAGARVDLQVIEESDTKTMKWVSLATVMPTIIGRISGNALKVAAFTEAAMAKQ